MKIFLTVVITTLLCWSCIKEENNTSDPELCGTEVCLSFALEETIHSRAFGDNTATKAEKAVLSAKFFIFKSGIKIFEQLLTAGELSSIGSQPISFSVPGMVASTSYDYYMIINDGDVSAANQANLQSITFNDIQSYNGPWNTVNDASETPNRSGGFVMTGKTTQSTGADLTQPQNISITVKRITAKVDINTVINSSVFGSGNKYSGTMTIDSAIISKTQPTSTLLVGTPPVTVGTLTLAKQSSNAAVANSNYQNRFYLFENGALPAGSRVLLSLYGTYTNNGTSTPVVYLTELTGDNTGAIVRNGAYKVVVNINGLTGSSISVSVTLGDWETIVTQTANLGS